MAAMARPFSINGNEVDLGGRDNNFAVQSIGGGQADTDYVLVQLKEEPSKADLTRLEEQGAKLQQVYEHKVLLMRYPPRNFDRLLSTGLVQKIFNYSDEYKVHDILRKSAERAPSSTQRVSVVLHEDKPADVETIKRQVASSADVAESDIKTNGNQLVLNLSNEQLKSVARVPGVRLIESRPDYVLFNRVARGIIGVDDVFSTTSYDGKGQVIAVADTGLDRGKLDDMHPALRGKVLELVPVGRPDRTDDPRGHGTHVCGSVLGNPVEVKGEGQLSGAAPQAQLVMQSILNADNKLFPYNPYPLGELFLGPYRKHGARIHTNSWGLEYKTHQWPYDDRCSEIDKTMWDQPDLLICFAAGNEGDVSVHPTLGSQAASKNCLTVGATESSRPSVEGVYTPNKAGPNDVTEISWYSSRGPTAEGRIKPDVVAPGTTILSARSRAVPPDKNRFGPSPDPLFMYDTGTSMATPLVAGAAAVLRQALVDHGIKQPSGALLKALLINGAFSLHHAHDAFEGFGRVNLSNSLIFPAQTTNAGFATDDGFVHQEDGPTDRGQEKHFKVRINGPPANATHGLTVHPPAPDAGVTLKVTLVYNDFPGASLQNDLNLIVRTADGIERHGNMGSSSAFDGNNNVEQVVWKGVPPGDAEIIVRAKRVVTAKQDFVIVWRIIPTEA